jgi:hypothetical protein
MSLSHGFLAVSMLVLPLIAVGCSTGGTALVERSSSTKNALARAQNERGVALVTTGRTPLFQDPSPTATVLRTMGADTAATSLGDSQDGFLHVDVAGDQGWARSTAFAAPADDSSGSSGTGDGSGSGSGTGDGSAADLCVSTINGFRSQNGLPPLQRWTEQEDCASGEAGSDSQTGTAHGAFPSCTEVAQNECPGFPGDPSDALPQCLQTMIDEGPGGGHYDNIMNPDYTMVSCGITTGADGSMWSVQDFR